MKIVLVGMSHRTAPVEVRERFAVSDPGPILRKLTSSEEIEEAVLISTCNRVEWMVTTRQPEAASLRLRGLLGGDHADEYIYEHRDRHAVAHLFRVASAMDSMVLGEPQILGQVKDAYRLSVEAGSCRSVLSRLFQHAFGTAKRVRNETRISEGPISVARVAVDLARQIFENFHGKTALLLGAGEMIELALEALRRAGLEQVRVANRTRAHAEQLAERFAATPHGLEDLDSLLLGSDIVLTCVGGDRPLLDRARVAAAMGGRRHRPAFIIDIGVPRNVHPEVNQLDNVYLYDVDDLQELAAANAEGRQRESAQAERIIVEEQERFDGWLVALQAVPTIRHLRSRAEGIRQAELERSLSRLDLDEHQRDGVEALTRSIVNKLLHPPLSRLREEKDREEGLALREAARALFELDAEKDAEDDER